MFLWTPHGNCLQLPTVGRTKYKIHHRLLEKSGKGERIVPGAELIEFRLKSRVNVFHRSILSHFVCADAPLPG